MSKNILCWSSSSREQICPVSAISFSGNTNNHIKILRKISDQFTCLLQKRISIWFRNGYLILVYTLPANKLRVSLRVEHYTENQKNGIINSSVLTENTLETFGRRSTKKRERNTHRNTYTQYRVKKEHTQGRIHAV